MKSRGKKVAMVQQHWRFVSVASIVIVVFLANDRQHAQP
jgi:hypothetical protein